MSGSSVKFIKIKIVENGKSKINLTLPAFLITFPFYLIPQSVINRWIEEDIDIKGIINEVKKSGKGTEINVKDDTEQVQIVLK